MKNVEKTITGNVDPDVLEYTVGEDPVLDRALVKWDAAGTAAHVTMLSRMKLPKGVPPVVTPAEAARVRRELAVVVKEFAAGKFEIRESDQDVHMAVERRLIETLGDLGKKIHTGRSRNDQVAVDVRLHIKDQLLALEDEVAAFASALCAFGKRHSLLPQLFGCVTAVSAPLDRIRGRSNGEGRSLLLQDGAGRFQARHKQD